MSDDIRSIELFETPSLNRFLFIKYVFFFFCLFRLFRNCSWFLWRSKRASTAGEHIETLDFWLKLILALHQLFRCILSEIFSVSFSFANHSAPYVFLPTLFIKITFCSGLVSSASSQLFFDFVCLFTQRHHHQVIVRFRKDTSIRCGSICLTEIIIKFDMKGLSLPTTLDCCVRSSIVFIPVNYKPQIIGFFCCIRLYN